MKLIIILTLLLISQIVLANSNMLYYEIEEGDTFEMVIYSLGYKKLWANSAYLNKFKNRIETTDVIPVRKGDKFYIERSEVLFSRNLEYHNDRITFRRKIWSEKEWKSRLKAGNIDESKFQRAPKTIILEKVNSRLIYSKSKSSFELYPGLGGFLAKNIESNGSTKTTTVTGVQPMGQLKAIYSHASIGSLAFDLLLKQIINNKYTFPVNIDARIQYIPKWIDLKYMNLALSYSSLRHSYVGKSSSSEKAFELEAHFLGVGVIVPRGSYWYEVYLEKAVSGKTKSSGQSLNLHDGWRIDSELIYPLGKKLRFIPGINYYHTASNSQDYTMNVLEFRSTIAWEFDL